MRSRSSIVSATVSIPSASDSRGESVSAPLRAARARGRPREGCADRRDTPRRNTRCRNLLDRRQSAFTSSASALTALSLLGNRPLRRQRGFAASITDGGESSLSVDALLLSFFHALAACPQLWGARPWPLPRVRRYDRYTSSTRPRTRALCFRPPSSRRELSARPRELFRGIRDPLSVTHSAHGQSGKKTAIFRQEIRPDPAIGPSGESRLALET